MDNPLTPEDMAVLWLVAASQVNFDTGDAFRARLDALVAAAKAAN